MCHKKAKMEALNPKIKMPIPNKPKIIILFPSFLPSKDQQTFYRADQFLLRDRLIY